MHCLAVAYRCRLPSRHARLIDDLLPTLSPSCLLFWFCQPFSCGQYIAAFDYLASDGALDRLVFARFTDCHRLGDSRNADEPCDGDGAAVVAAREWKVNFRRPHIAAVLPIFSSTNECCL
jgi:hypothetical protein